ncbi:hypothetical protein B5F33_07940 [Collinsella sp. An2]|nr:hypothetical protein B5F33_07940 [Collinsella sp. An2]
MPIDVSATYDVAVIGGGASGLAAAFCAARAGARVAVLERDVFCGLPILATGNGRCNLSNTNLDPARYRHPDVARAVMGPDPEREVADLTDAWGIVTCSIDDRLYPFSRRAESVRDALLAACARQGVELCCGLDLVEASYERAAGGAEGQGAWNLVVEGPERPLRGKRGGDFHADLRARRRDLKQTPRVRHTVAARSVIIACGGSSLAMASCFGLPHIEERPVLCPVACSIDDRSRALAALDGLRVDARLTLLHDGIETWREAGEVLFRPYGVSGIVAFDLSRRALPGDEVVLDPFYTFSPEELDSLMSRRASALAPLTPGNPSWYDGFLARPLAELLTELGTTTIRLRVQGTADERVAQVRAGGIPFEAVDVPSLRISSSAAPYLFACGEALDMDADCGGFNLAWAWLSGKRAGESAAQAATRG